MNAFTINGEIFLSFFISPITIYFTIDVPQSFVGTVVNNIKSIERRIQVKEFYLTEESYWNVGTWQEWNLGPRGK